MDFARWAPIILALVCGGLVYWKVKSSCDSVMNATWNKLPLVGDIKCGKTKFVNWVIILLAIVCACSCLRLTSRVRDFVSPSYYAY